MSFDKLRESGAVETPENPATDDWIGNLDSDFIEAKIAEFEKLQAEDKSGKRSEMDGKAIDTLFDRYSDTDIDFLDENTIDTDFLSKARNADGTDSCPFIDDEKKKKDRAAWYKYSPHTSQEDSDGSLMPEGFKVDHLEHGTVLYQLGKENASSEWFTDSETVDSCRDPNTGKVDISLLKEKLQIEDSNNEKNVLRVFMVNSPEGIKVAEGTTGENRQYGEGGGKQFFITPDYRKLTELEE